MLAPLLYSCAYTAELEDENKNFFVIKREQLIYYLS
jgi:hypothetical protein